MRYASILASGVILSAALFTSCTCHKEVTAPPSSSTLEERRVGWPVKITPRPMDVAETTPEAQETPPQVVEARPTPANMPPDFPADVPIYKDASLSEVQDLANSARNVIFKTADTIPNVYHFYEDQMRSNGWQVTQQVQRGTHAFIGFKKGYMIANLTIAEDPQNPGKQVIAIMYEQEKPLEFDEF